MDMVWKTQYFACESVEKVYATVSTQWTRLCDEQCHRDIELPTYAMNGETQFPRIFNQCGPKSYYDVRLTVLSSGSSAQWVWEPESE